MQSDDNQWMDPLLWELAADLGGAPPADGVVASHPAAPKHISSPPEVQSVSQPFLQSNGYRCVQLAATGGIPMQAAVQLDHAVSLPASWGSATNGLLGANHLGQMPCYGQAGILHTQPAGIDYTLAASAAAAVHHQRPVATDLHSPSSSSGGPQGDDYAMELTENNRTRKPAGVNKGALAQKRFRERQKEKMRQNEQQVAELTQRLDMLQMEKAKLESRARLLEQVVSLNLTHEARLHTNKEIMIREQEMLLAELAEFVIMLDEAVVAAANGNNSSSSSTSSSVSLQSLLLGSDSSNLQQQQQLGYGAAAAAEQQLSYACNNGSSNGSSAVVALTQVLRNWNVSVMTDTIFPQYISCLQQLLHVVKASNPLGLQQQHLQQSAAAAASSPAATAQQEVSKLVLRRREMTDRHALFSHYYWAIWCLNKSEIAASNITPPTYDSWRNVLQQLQLSREQMRAVAAARKSLLLELQQVASEWQKVLPTLALQLLQVPKAQWHTVAAVQSMVANLAAEREAVVAFLHTIVDEVLTPLQEGQLEASSYPWCPDVWTIAAHTARAAAATTTSSGNSADSGNTSGGHKGSKARKQQQQQQQDAADGGPAAAAATVVDDEDPLAALAMGTDVLQPLMPFMTAFQLLRAPVTARGAGLRLKRALLLDPFKTVVPAAAFHQPSATKVAQMSLLDAHCGTFQDVMLWDWLKVNVPGYLTLPGLNTADIAPAAAAAAVAARTSSGTMHTITGLTRAY